MSSLDVLDAMILTPQTLLPAQERGYALPRIVFWNLRGSDRGGGRNASVPVTKGVSCGITALFRSASGQVCHEPRITMPLCCSCWQHVIRGMATTS